MPLVQMSVECYAGTLASIQEHFEQRTLEKSLPSLRVPTVFTLGADSPAPPRHGIASAELIPGARWHVEPDCGHFPWLESPGSVRKALDSLL
jgi:pimeloyl-ACP methyl ester carboxylesterase